MNKINSFETPTIVTEVHQMGGKLNPTFIVVLRETDSVETWKEVWDPWDVDLRYSKETKLWTGNGNRILRISTPKRNSRATTNMLNECKC